MRHETARVTFLPGGESALVPIGVTVLEAARSEVGAGSLTVRPRYVVGPHWS